MACVFPNGPDELCSLGLGLYKSKHHQRFSDTEHILDGDYESGEIAERTS